MLLAEYLRSTPFRIAITYAGWFAVSVVVLFGVVYWLVTDEIMGELGGAIEQDVASLLAVFGTEMASLYRLAAWMSTRS